MNEARNPELILDNLVGPVAVVAHDAGAANHIAEWLQKRRVNYFATAEGPAKAIFTDRCSWLGKSNLEKLIPNCKTLISGTGWASSLEHEARRLAKNIGCRCIAVVDHWTDYRERFIRFDEEILPDEIWVTDDYARKIAQKEFPSTPIVRLQNAYLTRLKNEVMQRQVLNSASNYQRILYLLEPIRDDWGVSPIPGEFIALEFFISNLTILGLRGALIRLRPHPSDPIGKYDDWLKSHPDLDLVIDDLSSLADSLAWADIVVGCQTYAMVIALAAGKKVVSTIPSGMPPCALPYEEIICLANLVGAGL